MLKLTWKNGLWIGVPMLALAACGVDNLGATSQALTDPHSLQGESDRYGLDLAPGVGTNRLAVVYDAVGNASNFESRLNAERTALGLSSCTLASGCLKIINENGGSTLPTDDATKNADAALAAASLSLGSPSAPITVISPSSRASVDLATALTTMYGISTLKGAVVAFGPASPSDQAAFSTQIQAHPAIAIGATAGLFQATNVIQVGASQLVSGTEANWFMAPVTPDIDALGHNILRSDGVSVDSLVAPVGAIVGVGMTRAQIQAAPSTDFAPITGVTKGVFNL